MSLLHNYGYLGVGLAVGLESMGLIWAGIALRGRNAVGD
jgi:hypothetical protein